MKKRKWRIYSLIALLFLVLSGWRMNAQAAGTVTIFIDQKSLNVDDTLKVTVQTSEPEDDAIPPEVTLTYDNSLLEFTYCSEEYGGGEGGLITLHSTTANLTFVAKKAGTAYLNAEAIIDDDGNNKATASRSVSIGGTAATESVDNRNDEKTEDNEENAEDTDSAENTDDTDTENITKVLSSDASLKKFKVTDAKLSPKFSADVMDYTVTLEEDVKQLVFTAKTTDTNAKILAVSGFSNLKNGTNKAVLNVAAEDGTIKTYTFTIIKEGKAQSNEDTSQRESVEAVNGYISVEDSDLYVNTTFPEELVPEGFVKIDYVYKEQIVEAAYFEMGELILLYLSGNDGSMSDFYLYYSGTDEFMDFIQLKGAEGHFIFPIKFPVGVVIPDGFQDSALQWNDKTVSAFMVSQSSDETDSSTETVTEEEASQAESQDAEAVDEQMQQGNQYAQPEDYYLVYAMNQDGGEGFYLYDSLEGTYQRYLDLTVEESTTGSFDEESYVIYKEKSQKRMVVIGILIVAIVILCFLLLNMFLKIRELEAGLDEEEDDEDQDDENHNDVNHTDEGNGNDSPSQNASLVKKETKQSRNLQKKQENPTVKEKKKPSKLVKPAKENVKKTRSGQTEKVRKSEVPVTEKKLETDKDTKQKRRPAPVMFDLSTPKVDGSLTPKMQREQLDDDFEFEFINIDE